MDATLLANNSQDYWMLQGGWMDGWMLYMLRPFAHPVACCCALFGVFAQSLKPVKLMSQQLPTFLLFCDHRSVVQ